MAVSELPGNPNAVWTVRRHVEGMQYSPKAQGCDNVFGVFCLFGVFFGFLSKQIGKVLHDGCVPSPEIMF